MMVGAGAQSYSDLSLCESAGTGLGSQAGQWASLERGCVSGRGRGAGSC